VSQREDASQPEMVYEAVSRALEYGAPRPKDIDAVIFSTMSLFSGLCRSLVRRGGDGLFEALL